jgi:vacuolar-type H+-ATPase subunit H
MMDQAGNEPGSMDILYLLERLEEVLGAGSRVPFTSRTLVDDEECFAIIDQIRLSLPNEIRQARMVNSERDALLDEARARADHIVKMAESEAQERVRDHHITQQAQAEAGEIIAQADRDSTKTRQDADDYVYRVLIDLDQHLEALSTTVRNGLHAIRGSRDLAEQASGLETDRYGRSTRWSSEADDASLE